MNNSELGRDYILFNYNVEECAFMQVLEGSIKKKDPILNKNYVSTNNFYLRDYLSEVNRQSLRQILIAFLRENILESYYQDGNLTFKLPKLKCFIYISQVRLNSLLRFTEFEKVFLVNSEQNVTENITDPIKLLEIVKKELNITFDVEQWDKVSREVGNHIQNTVLINWQKDKIKNDLVKRDSNDFSNSFREHKKLSDCSFKFEQLAFNGHPYHPFAKTKVGFSIEDILSYTTEFRPKVFILLAAVRKDAMCIEMTQEKFVFSRWFSEYYPDAWDLWVYELNKRNLHHEDYIPFPLHPWQAINSVKNLFSDHISANEVILFDNVAIEMSPTSSFRTLAPVKNWYAPYIKLPIGIYASGVLRTLSVTSIKNTPKITHIMKNILAKENSISERLAILPEICGLYLNAVEDDKAKHFTAIFRENVTNYLANNEIAIVVSALFEKLSANDTSLFIELVQLAGCLSYKDTLNYFAKYVDLVLGSYLDIYLIYGIALEGHQQNTLAVFENGHIKRFIARDFDGIEIYADSLNSHNFNLNSPLSPPFVTHNKMTVRNQLLHTVYQLHLGELVLLLAAHFKGEEKDFWNIIREKTEERFFALEERVDTARWKDEYQAILKADWPVKALFRMRLEKQYVREGIFSYIENPLAI